MSNTSPNISGPLDILLPTIGSAGDVHPVIELGVALKKRGHEVTLISNAFFARQVKDADCHICQVSNKTHRWKLKVPGAQGNATFWHTYRR